jgi:hypothetical protein
VSGASFPAALLAALDRFAEAGHVARFWLRDDDAVAPTPALEQLLALGTSYEVPLTLAVIPEPTGPALAHRLDALDPDKTAVSVTVHGWAHVNHSPVDAKRSELGAGRPHDAVLSELKQGFAKLCDLHGARLQPVLVPPWNRIDPALLPFLPALGFRGLSVYGPEKEGVLRRVNTHVDVIDWHGTRGCRDFDVLEAELVARLEHCLENSGSIGLLTHHLVHDSAVWVFLDQLLHATRDHPACLWVGIGELIADR